ncbi:CHASE3 domain-containing protein [Sphingomonas sp. BGYR3]|uniref:CHASE3 domain-containing protein n=1 Tax=Sphingomonas sp. BGYR3 TaxID=2975483 RepID=UPI0021A2D437|nr:CHASE3 domain-containing protein [Sphingomonas sp. BGYR3]MDG5489319.1 CHASE3 domain-containing protein [Sphingomonas sp. BGYR3]
MTRRPIDARLLILASAFLILTAAIVATIMLVRDQRAANERVLHTLQVHDRIGSIVSIIQDTETGARGYALTRNPEFAEPFLMARRRLPGELNELVKSVSDNPEQFARARQLQVLAARKLAISTRIVDAARLGGMIDAAAVVREGEGRRVMDEIRALSGEMKDIERGLLRQRDDAANSQTRNVLGWLVLSALGTLLLGAFVLRQLQRRLGQANDARDQLAAANQLLIEEAGAREEAQSQVRQLQKMESIGQLTGGIAHDFNNMLAIVTGSLELAVRHLGTNPERAGQMIGNAQEGARRAAELTARLLAFSRQSPLAPRAIDANRLVGGMSELLRRTLGDGIRVETVLAGGLWPCLIDAGQLENAILNLSVNARDAMGEGGRLTIETANAHLDDAYAAEHVEVTAGQYVMISVSDTGSGMPPEVMQRAFDPFFTTKGVGKGTGLGLSQVYGFIKQSGGHVKIYSETEVGTTIKLYLPRHFGEVAVPSLGVDAGEQLPQAREGEVVLVVEDEERVRRMSVTALEELGYRVIEAADPHRALALLDQRDRIDLLFTDVIMPDLNGRLLAEAAREKRPGLPVLYTTGYTRNAIVHNGMLDHDVAFLAKPFTMRQLAEKVRQVIDGEAGCA